MQLLTLIGDAMVSQISCEMKDLINMTNDLVYFRLIASIDANLAATVANFWKESQAISQLKLLNHHRKRKEKQCTRFDIVNGFAITDN